MHRFTFKSPASALLAVATLVAIPFSARAGLVTGSWDPPFGSALPGLFWGVRAQFNVPDACAAQGDGVYATNLGACAGASTIDFYLRLFNSSATNNFFDNSDPTKSFALNLQGLAGANHEISQIKVVSGQVVGLQAGYLGSFQAPVWTTAWNNLAEAQLMAFGAAVGLLGARPECLGCFPSSPDSPYGTLYGQTAGMEPFLVTYDTDPGTNQPRPKLTDANGNAVGVRLNDQGVILGLASVDPQDRFAPSAAGNVPEPGALALVSLALGALGWSRRRRT